LKDSGIDFLQSIADGIPGTSLIGRNVQVYQNVSSTNEVAKRLCQTHNSAGLVVVANEQTRGRGRRGSFWHSPPGVGLWFSVLLPQERSIDLLGIYALTAGYSVANGIEACTGKATELKWPNDVLLDRKKVSGVLIETFAMDNVCEGIIVGIGINVNQSSFPDKIRDIAISLKQVCGNDISRTELFFNVIQELENNYFRIQKSELPDVIFEWKQKCPAINTAVVVQPNNRNVKGFFSDIDDMGRMIVQLEGGGQVAVTSNDQVEYQESAYASRY